MMAELLADPRVRSSADLATAFRVFDSCRRERTQWLVASSRFMGEAYDLRNESVGSDSKKLEKEITTRNQTTLEADVDQMVEAAKAELGKQLG